MTLLRVEWNSALSGIALVGRHCIVMWYFISMLGFPGMNYVRIVTTYTFL